MGGQLAGFMVDAVGHLNAIELALLGAESERARMWAIDQLRSLQETAEGLMLARTAGIAEAAAALLARGPEANPFALRAMARLRDLLRTLEKTGVEPHGDDHDLLAAAERHTPLADTLARARDRLLEISPAERDPRLGALIARLIALGAELERLELGDALETGANARDTAA